MRLPGASRASDWVSKARRYIAAHRALDEIESALGSSGAAWGANLIHSPGEPELEEIAFEYRYSDPDDIWDALVSLAGPLAEVIGRLPEDELEATRAAIEQNLAAYRQDDGTYTIPASSWGVLAS